MLTYAALDIHQQISSNIEYYSLEQPRAGNEAFAKYFNSKIRNAYRLTHYKDPVPHLPTLSMGFYHVAQEVFYNEAMNSYKICNGEDNSCSD